VAKEEIRYRTFTAPKQIVPVDTNFGIVIPKIGANAKVIANVDWKNQGVYTEALSRGVAHAKGSALPGKVGNVFIFAHSAGNFYEANRYNAIFYLLDKLVKGDEIDIYYNGGKFTYFVTNKATVDGSQVQYLSGNDQTQTLTLMTCWPPGTTFKRLIIQAKPSL